MLRRLALLLAAACLLAGCGEEAAGEGSAQLWITRDRGAEVVLSTTVPAGISALEALRRKAEVETRYGGRFVQAIDGIEGDIAGQHDWFYFVNGYEADISAADYELHDGDVLWWDHRSWEGAIRQPVVVGAFPEPFLHGWDGKRVRRSSKVHRRTSATGSWSCSVPRPAVPSEPSSSSFRALVSEAASMGAQAIRSCSSWGRLARRLVEAPSTVRYRYEVP